MILLLILLVLAPAAADQPLAETQARFGVVTGDVGLLNQGAKEWIEPHEGLPIEPGDEIRTGEDGRVELLSSENTLWMMEPQSDLATERMTESAGRFNLSSGTLMGKVDAERTAGTVQHWEFNTPAAMAIVGGNEFILECSKKETHLAVFDGTIPFEPAETAEGLQPAVDIPTGKEAVAQRGHPIKILKSLSPLMQAHVAALPAFRRRLKQVENTWSPFTPATRLEARRKFVKPPVISKAPKPKVRKRKVPVENSSSSF